MGHASKNGFRRLHYEEYKMTEKRGRPPVKDKAKFKTVAVPIDAYNLLRVAAEREHRSIARQLAFMVEQQESRAS
jgi:hypothetical protein